MLSYYLEILAEKLKRDGKVYLAPAAMETVVIAKMLQYQYGVLPTGFCDNDTGKQGKQLNSFRELQIVSFDEALQDKESEFFVVSPHHGAAIIGGLIFEKKIASDRILNYSPVEKKFTCPFFSSNWIVKDRSFYCCCMPKAPLFDNDAADPQGSIARLDQQRKGMIEKRIALPEKCRTCFHNRETYIYRSRKLSSFNFSFRGWCNYKCEYCSANQPELKDYNPNFSMEQYLKALEEMDLVNDVFSVLYAVGEPCLNEKRFGLYEQCAKKQYFLDVFSNCSVFDKELFALAKENPVIIRKSFDAGTPETYLKIKGVDLFDKAANNVVRYLDAPYLAFNPKYLFVPGTNDNEKDVEKFVEMCCEWRVDFVTPVFSIFDDAYANSGHAKKMFHYLIELLTENGIFTANVDTLYNENYHKLYTESF